MPPIIELLRFTEITDMTNSLSILGKLHEINLLIRQFINDFSFLICEEHLFIISTHYWLLKLIVWGAEW